MLVHDLQPQTPAPLLPSARSGPPATPPVLSFGAEPVDPRTHRYPGTGWQTTVAFLIIGVAAIGLTVATTGIFLIAILFTPLIDKLFEKRRRALVKGSGVRVGPDQLPFLHQCVQDFSQRLGLKETPEVYIVEDSVQNGVTFKIGRKNLVLLTDDIVWGALQSQEPRSLGFIVGHELAHVSLGHTRLIRGMARQLFRPLSRSDEMTADAVARALVRDARIAVAGLTTLTVGPQLLPYLNEQALLRQAREVEKDKATKKAERKLSHPLLLRRIANMIESR